MGLPVVPTQAQPIGSKNSQTDCALNEKAVNDECPVWN